MAVEAAAVAVGFGVIGGALGAAGAVVAGAVGLAVGAVGLAVGDADAEPTDADGEIAGDATGAEAPTLAVAGTGVCDAAAAEGSAVDAPELQAAKTIRAPRATTASFMCAVCRTARDRTMTDTER